MDKKPNTNKSSSIVTVPAFVPPARKADIIAALVERARAKHQEETKELEQKRLDKKKELYAAVMSDFEVNPKSFTMKVEAGLWSCNAPMIVLNYIGGMPAKIKKLKKTYHDAPTMRPFDAAAVRRVITDKMTGSGGDRVKALLANPETVKKLDETLAAII